jgi:hypothetical protein
VEYGAGGYNISAVKDISRAYIWVPDIMELYSIYEEIWYCDVPYNGEQSFFVSLAEIGGII